ncbi:TIM barrel protein [Pseudomonas sp. I2]|uniref:TIM barrel protein n=1 Tax=Pseudomonas sp. I2 TaxID=1338438 RepID=UPI0034D3F83F
MPFGEGCVDFVGIFKTLHELNYRGSFLIEMWTEKAKEPVTGRVSFRWIAAIRSMPSFSSAGTSLPQALRLPTSG